MPKVNEPSRPRLTNRGGAGLLGKLTDEQRAGLVKRQESLPQLTEATAKYRIAPGLKEIVVVPIDSLVPDPDNARLHPEKNLEAVRKSLTLYGQLKPLVVRKANNVVVAGNGTLEVAKSLGWTEIAVVFAEMNEVEAAGFGLADNRSAELAKWHLETVARLDKLLAEAGHASIGWTQDELDVLRAADWSPPVVDSEGGDNYDNGKEQPLVVSFSATQGSVIAKAIDLVKGLTGEQEADQAETLTAICQDWLNLQGTYAEDKRAQEG